ncbi:MAG TPA: type II toxin-antitoxin system RelE/ParE family toxin [Candidatus Dormibacteraeota bacterium]|nr:type II toxin-antitoxin system RelE/ParE family toxin [Candidatus Dormibacteraeota bacterium]HVA11298.1 type II toxin-antitoxin system RelE/ParE family toxin [Candidatus Dormibacteraeota bacterium]
MASYSVKIKNSAQKEIRKLPSKELRAKVISIINGLYINPVPDEAKKIKGSNNIYRIRQGTYRIVYQIHKKELLIMVIRVRHRKDAYKNL